MEENTNDIMETISNIGRILLYVLIGMAAFFIKRTQEKQRRRKSPQIPEPDPELAKPIIEHPKPVVKPKKKFTTTATDKRYFTYENEADYASRTSERKEQQAEKQHIDKEQEGSAVDFDLRAAVISSEILKPKFED